MSLVPFADGKPRPKKILSLGLFRTGSQSLAEALRILGYRDVFHTTFFIDGDLNKWNGISAAADDNISCLPTFTGRNWSLKDWEAYFGPCEALTDVPQFAEPLLETYPEARVILVRRNFDAWSKSFLDTIIRPSTEGIMAWLSTNMMESLMGLHVSRVIHKQYMGLLGVSDIEKTKNMDVLKTGYDRHHRMIREMIPANRLLEIDLEDLGWEPLCEFLEKDVPEEPFPRSNESSILREKFRGLHRSAVMGGLGVIVLCTGGAWLCGYVTLAAVTRVAHHYDWDFWRR